MCARENSDVFRRNKNKTCVLLQSTVHSFKSADVKFSLSLFDSSNVSMENGNLTVLGCAFGGYRV